MTDHDAVLKAAADLVAAFGSHNTEAYFASFATDATLLFHNVDRLMTSRQDYMAEWKEWEAAGFRVHSCASREQNVQVIGDVAVFSHRVSTSLEDADGLHHSDERETIVFRRADTGRWLVAHEHLSLG
jgi:ketosteroid isomerase-like protein